MIPHPRRCMDPLDPAECETIYAAALRILDETGIAVLSDESRGLLESAGARLSADRALIPPEVVERAVARAPRTFTLHARNPARSVELGTDTLLVSPGYGSPSVADAQGMRREATLADFDAFASLAGVSESIDVTGGLLVEPMDVPPALRPLEITRSLLMHSDKPFLGSVDGAEGARESIETARCVFGDLGTRTVMMGLVNVNSPLRLDAPHGSGTSGIRARGPGRAPHARNPHGSHRTRDGSRGRGAGSGGAPWRAWPWCRRPARARPSSSVPEGSGLTSAPGGPGSAGRRTRWARSWAHSLRAAWGCRSAAQGPSPVRGFPTAAAATSG